MNNPRAEPVISRRRQHPWREHRSAARISAGYGAQHACKDHHGTREVRLRSRRRGWVAATGRGPRLPSRNGRGRCHADLRVVIAQLNPILRGWGAYFCTGNAARSFNQIDTYVYERLRGLRIKRAGRQLSAGTAPKWTREYFWNLGLHRLKGTVKYPEATQYRSPESPPA